MKAFFRSPSNDITIYHGDCLQVLPYLLKKGFAGKAHAVLTNPPTAVKGFSECADFSRLLLKRGGSYVLLNDGCTDDFLRKLVSVVAQKAGLILDPFMGRGAVGVAAKAAGCTFIGIDTSEERCDAAVKRFEV